MTWTMKMFTGITWGNSPTVSEGVGSDVIAIKGTRSLPLPVLTSHRLVRLHAPSLHSSQHYYPNQSTKRPHKEPVHAKLPPAHIVSTDDPGFSRQDRATGLLFFDTEVPNPSR